MVWWNRAPDHCFQDDQGIVLWAAPGLEKQLSHFIKQTLRANGKCDKDQWVLGLPQGLHPVGHVLDRALQELT